MRCVISTSFADIFYNNCFKNGILPIVVTPEQLKLLMDDAERGSNATISVDLESQTIKGPDGGTLHFDIDPSRKQTLLEGLDDIAATMKEGAEISGFEQKVASAEAVDLMVKRISTGSPFESEDRLFARRRRRGHGLCLGHDRLRLRDHDDARGRRRSRRATRSRTIDKALSEAGSSTRGRRARRAITSATWRSTTRVVAAAGEVFGDIRPAATMVIVGLTTPEMKIEIEVTARIGASRELIVEIVAQARPDADRGRRGRARRRCIAVQRRSLGAPSRLPAVRASTSIDADGTVSRRR